MDMTERRVLMVVVVVVVVVERVEYNMAKRRMSSI
jgi:hypothetical protein